MFGPCLPSTDKSSNRNLSPVIEEVKPFVFTMRWSLIPGNPQIIRNPAQTVQNLSSQLPGAAVFFLTYMGIYTPQPIYQLAYLDLHTVSQGLAGAGTALLQLVPLVMHFLHKWFLGRTPRQAYDVRSHLLS